MSCKEGRNWPFSQTDLTTSARMNSTPCTFCLVVVFTAFLTTSIGWPHPKVKVMLLHMQLPIVIFLTSCRLLPNSIPFVPSLPWVSPVAHEPWRLCHSSFPCDWWEEINWPAELLMPSCRFFLPELFTSLWVLNVVQCCSWWLIFGLKWQQMNHR